MLGEERFGWVQSLLPAVLVPLTAFLWILCKWLPFSEPLHTVKAYGLPPAVRSPPMFPQGLGGSGPAVG